MADFFQQMCAVLAETGRRYPGRSSGGAGFDALFSEAPSPAVREKAEKTEIPVHSPAPALQESAPRTAAAADVVLPAASGPAAEKMAALAASVAGCGRCALAGHRNRIVFGEGDPDARLMFIGEGPGGDEDRLGRPFVGKAGQLLDRMIAAMQFKREEVYIANIVKCRPPGNRNPMPEEAEHCLPILHRQIGIVRPEVIVLLGAVAARYLLKAESGISKLRGRWCSYENIPVMPTFHPAFLLRQESAKREAWHDLQMVMARLGKVYRR